MMYYNGFYPSSMFWGLGSLFHILFWVVLIYLLIQVFKHSKHSFKNDRSQDILKERYAKGEITKEQFESIRKDLM